jgi:hypothetical protein
LRVTVLELQSNEFIGMLLRLGQKHTHRNIFSDFHYRVGVLGAFSAENHKERLAGKAIATLECPPIDRTSIDCTRAMTSRLSSDARAATKGCEPPAAVCASGS